MAAAAAQADSGREMAWPSSWRGGRGEWLGVAAWGVRNRGTAARDGRRGERRRPARAQLDTSAWKKKGTGKVDEAS
jgi:hypothetical protein